MSWKSISLESVSERFISGGTPSTTNKSFWRGDIPWITGADFNEDGVVLGRRFINEEAISNSATNLVPKGSVLLVTKDRSWEGCNCRRWYCNQPGHYWNYPQDLF